jgi:cytochrome b
MQAGYEQRKVWDPLIRVWHWLLVLTVVGGWLLGEYRDFDTIAYHMYLGYSTGGLLALRILWGFAGPRPVRFRALAVSPAALRKYLGGLLRRAPSGVAGHNPLGALSVIAMLGSLALQVITGLFSEDDGLFSEGPLAGMVSSGTRATLGSIHHQNAKVLLVLVGLHLAAIFFYLVWKRENLIRPMVTGWKTVRRED